MVAQQANATVVRHPVDYWLEGARMRGEVVVVVVVVVVVDIVVVVVVVGSHGNAAMLGASTLGSDRRSARRYLTTSRSGSTQNFKAAAVAGNPC